MQQYNKALMALATGILGALSAFGIGVPEGIQSMVNMAIPFIGGVLVYLIPNKT